MNNQESFDNRVDEWVAAEIARGADFEGLIARLPGVYPSIILKSISRLAAFGIIPSGVLRSVVRSSKSGTRRPIGAKHTVRLPIPHPLDFDWRFSDTAAGAILEVCTRLTKPTDTIALLGAPSVMRHAYENRFSRRMLLLDANPALPKIFPFSAQAQYVHCRIPTTVLPAVKAAVVVMDAPWYETDMKHFLWAASKLCTNEGHVVMSVPPEGTRPTIDDEWTRILKFAQRCGLELVKLESRKLSYVTPPFELNALEAEGILNVPENWRLSHCAILSRRSATRLVEPRRVIRQAVWHEINIRGVRIRVRTGHADAFDPRLIRLVKGDILPSVSRRDKRRRQAVVWTSGNRIFGCAAPSVLSNILEALSGQTSPLSRIESQLRRRVSSSERQVIRESIAQMNEVIDIEAHENARFVEFAESCLTRVHFSSIISQQSQRKTLIGTSG